MRHVFSILVICVCAMVGACAHLGTQWESPKIRLDAIEMLPSQGLNQRFRLGLRVLNPNDRVLPIKGLSYSLALNGFDLLDGVTGQVPTLQPFSETRVDVEASTDLVGALRFLNSLVKQDATQNLAYALTADVSVQGWMGKIKVTEEGEVPLFGAPAAK